MRRPTFYYNVIKIHKGAVQLRRSPFFKYYNANKTLQNFKVINKTLQDIAN